MPITPGTRAPDFVLRNQHGQTIELQELLSRRAVFVVFVPLAFSPVCSAEVSQLNEWHDIATSAGVEVVVLSVDSTATLRAWAEADGITLSLLADFWPHGAIAQSYGAFLDDKGFAQRASFLIDQSGIVRDVVTSELDEPRLFIGYERAIERLSTERR